MADTMKAVRIHEFGGPDKLVYEDAPKPEATEGEVLIQVTAAGINPVDAVIESGAFEQQGAHTLPLIPGWDVAGTVAAVGPGVSQFSVGDAVFAFADARRNGAYAEYVLVTAATLAAKPMAVDFTGAASIPLAGTTAWQALFEQAKLTSGQTILIHGAGGSVGGFAVQFAKAKGATVIATATGDDVAYVQSLGADTVIDYKAEKFEDKAQGVDVVLDTISGDTQARSWATLRDGGILVSTLPGAEAPADAAARGVIGKSFGAHPDAAALTEIARLVDAGQVKVRVGAVLPLPEAKQAQEQAASGHTQGKVVLSVP